ncbi:MAG: thioesterase family protein [Gammaproteobacteria bacterium]|nr:MAG: thioesterase family protein [Gammaproteobacteria bacterium]RLA37872.1 MAG: thioesterase family protein [Gammaproteobacteria bacterium]
MSDDGNKAFFRFDDGWFIGNDPSRGPWAADACHAGAVTGAIARALEQVVPEKQLTRLTVSFGRPVPITGFRVESKIERNGRSVTTTNATLRDQDNRICATASSLHIVTHSYPDLPSATIPRLSFAEARSGHFPITNPLHDLPFFGNNIEIAYPPEETTEPGPTTLWMRTLPILENEKPSPFQTLCPIADCGNGISRNADSSQATFVNADLTIVAYRLPESEWLASQAISFWQPSGIGVAQATLFDKVGSLGTALQTLIIRPVG